jgi:DNA-binding winged helix-turn-helix (wHTH) protein
MHDLQFDEHNYSVSYAGETLKMLPKEYALLAFLFRHLNQSFTRDQLLDAVWPLEEPVDRTVDDHVYRLRKKMKRWEHTFSIETIRSRGYRLVSHIHKEHENPLLHDRDYIEQISNVAQKFQQYGQFDALHLLVEQQKSLGVNKIPFYSMYSKLVAGDFHWLVDTTEVPIEERMYFLLLTFGIVQFDTEKSLLFYQRALEIVEDGSVMLRELQMLDLPLMYVFNGQVEEALKLLLSMHETVRLHELKFFIIPVANHETFFYLAAGDLEKTEAQLRKTEALIENVPYLRENGFFRINKGLWLLLQGQKREGVRFLQEGLQYIQQTHFVSLRAQALRKTLFVLDQVPQMEDLKRSYQKQWEELATQYDFVNVARKVESLLKFHLK